MCDSWSDLRALQARLGLKGSFLFGSAALGRATGRDVRPADLDLQARGGIAAERDLMEAIEHDSGFRLVSGPRDYWIFFDVHVRLFEVAFEDVVIDVNLMDTRIRPGHFSLETVRWDIERGVIEDPNHALGWKAGDPVFLVSSPDSDNPLRMLSRMLKLASKYDLSLYDPDGLGAVSSDLTTRAAAWTSRDPFHGVQARRSFARILGEVIGDQRTSMALRAEIDRLGVVACLSGAERACVPNRTRSQL